MKRAASLSWLLDRRTPWLSWWQELLLNWAASWVSVGALVVTAPDGDQSCEWSLPTDLELQRQQLEELL